MSKKLSLLGALTYFVAVAPLYALGNFEFDGSIDVKSVNTADTDFRDLDIGPPLTDDDHHDVYQRVLLGISADITDGVTYRAVLAETSALTAESFGSNTAGGALGPAGGGPAHAAGSLADAQDDIEVANSYLDIEDFVWGTLRVGRQFVGDEGDLILYFGPRNNDILTVTAVDALKVSWNIDDLFSIETFVAKTAEGHLEVLSGSDNDESLLGLVVRYDNANVEEAKVKAYTYTVYDRSAGGAAGGLAALTCGNGFVSTSAANCGIADAEDFFGVLGARISGNVIDLFVYGFELAINYGEGSRGAKGFAYDIMLGVDTTIGSVGLDSGVQLTVGSESFRDIAPDIQRNSIFTDTGLTVLVPVVGGATPTGVGIRSVTNVSVLSSWIDLQPMDQWTFGVRWDLVWAANEAILTAVQPVPSTRRSVGAIGYGLEGSVDYEVSDVVSASLTESIFVPVNQTFGKKTATKTLFALNIAY